MKFTFNLYSFIYRKRFCGLRAPRVHVFDLTFTFLPTNKGQRHTSLNKDNRLVD